DTHMSDLARLRARSSGAEEDDVAGCEGVAAHAHGTTHLAAHLVRRPADEDSREARRSLERLRLVDAPDEAGAVEAAGEHLAEEALRLVGGAGPHVRIADEPQRAVEHHALPLRQWRERKRVGFRSYGLNLVACQAEVPGDAVGSLRTRDRIG